MKTLCMIGGPMGVGKTAVCRELQRRLEGNVWAGRRSQNVIKQSVDYLPLCRDLSACCLETTSLTPAQAADHGGLHGKTAGRSRGGSLFAGGRVFLLGVYGRVTWMLLGAAVLGVGHIGVHLCHRSKIGKESDI